MKSIASANQPMLSGKQYHINCGPGDVASTVLIPGDPKRVQKIAALWDKSKEVAYHREYHTMTGSYQGVPLSCTSSGIGSPAIAIAIEELSRIGVETFIRVGSTGGIQPGQNLGDLVISTAAVRLDGASRDYVMIEYPAVASYEVVMALIEASEELGEKYHVGVTASTDTFYTGQGRPGYRNYLPSHKQQLFTDLQKVGVQNFEMETSCLFTLANIFGKRAGSICFLVANRVTNEFNITPEMARRAGLVASRATVILAGWDKAKRLKNKKYFFPKLLK
ncbi:uridine phosphorylase [Candidatus Roizmanbacteria bacterium RIFCSPHIGHO2_12_FULL_41_11]|uniref:Uridine phosphorylase n=2 Tax=Candidatus Roizmaniibacteriota TaxID=1752723 RepID=A0A1F7J721_9BACT|nr:MAG: uridine phosphorylase [Candidatus Roizmanbacteria bacterium RIFCSPHIGHO2_12_FULL_41_11]OGK51411.1 MAG: uridine phosphorylase [Candidatus Roizmanbacteria bacterium RIFCSPLOWO2_01_FULL_41_22]